MRTLVGELSKNCKINPKNTIGLEDNALFNTVLFVANNIISTVPTNKSVNILDIVFHRYTENGHSIKLAPNKDKKLFLDLLLILLLNK